MTDKLLLMPDHDVIHDLCQDLNGAELGTTGAKQRMYYEVAEQPGIRREPWNLKKRDHHGSELSKIFPVISCPGTRGEHFRIGDMDAVLVRGAQIQVFPWWQDIISFRLILRVLEFGVVIRAT